MNAVNVSEIGEVVRLAISGKFTFHTRREFVDAYTPWLDSTTIRTFEIDLGKVDYLDSSALGMMLLFKERAAEHGKKVALTNYQGVTQKIIEIAKFDKYFA